MNASSNANLTMPMPTLVKRHRFSLDTYEAMAEHGIFAPDDRVELLHGEIVDVSPIGTRHSACVKQLLALFRDALGGHATIGIQDPIGIPPDSEPEPDVSVMRPRTDFYASSHPRPADVLLLIEVSDSSLEIDRHVKAPLYAGAEIPELWIVDVEGDAVEVYRNPDAGRYSELKTYRRGQSVTPRAFPAVAFEIDRILPQKTD